MRSCNDLLATRIYSMNPWKCKFGNITENILNFKIVNQSTTGNQVEFGGMASATLEFSMMENSSLDIASIERDLQIGMNIDGSDYWISLGKFTPVAPTTQNGVMTFTAYDRISSKLNGTYESSISYYPTDVKNILDEIQAQTGVPIMSSDIPSGIFVDKVIASTETQVNEDGTTTEINTYASPFASMVHADVIREIAILCGKFAFIDNSGALRFKWYTNTSANSNAILDTLGKAIKDTKSSDIFDTTGGASSSSSLFVIPSGWCYDDLSLGEKTTTINSLMCNTNASGSLLAGNQETQMQFTCNTMTQTILDKIYNSVKGFSVTPSSFSIIGDPRIEVGDIVGVEKADGSIVPVPVMYSEIYFDGGLKQTISSYGLTDVSSSSQQYSPTQQAIQGIYHEMMTVRQLYADYIKATEILVSKITVDEAKIKKLIADEAVITEANFNDFAAKQGYITNLNVDKLTVDDATIERVVASKGYITSAEIDELIAESITSETSVIGGWTTEDGQFYRNYFENNTDNGLNYFVEVSVDEDGISFVSTNKSSNTNNGEFDPYYKEDIKSEYTLTGLHLRNESPKHEKYVDITEDEITIGDKWTSNEISLKDGDVFATGKVYSSNMPMIKRFEAATNVNISANSSKNITINIGSALNGYDRYVMTFGSYNDGGSGETYCIPTHTMSHGEELGDATNVTLTYRNASSSTINQQAWVNIIYIPKPKEGDD